MAWRCWRWISWMFSSCWDLTAAEWVFGAFEFLKVLPTPEMKAKKSHAPARTLTTVTAMVDVFILFKYKTPLCA